MASGDGLTDSDITDLRDTMSTFSVVSGAGRGDPHTLNAKACGKMVKDCLPKEVVTIADASVFPKYQIKGKKHMDLSDEKIKCFVRDCAHEFAKLKLENPKLPKDDASVKEYEREFADKLKKGKPNLHEIKTSKTGHVESLTDTSHYTGTHKKRFDETGHGKGIDGRVDRFEDTGYHLNYKDEGTYDKKH